MRQPISIVIADSQVLVRVGLKHLFSNKEKYNIIAEAANERDLLNQLDSTQPDVLIMDYDQPDNFSHSTLDQVRNRFPQTNILVISADNNNQGIYRVLESGVNSFLTKTCGEGEIQDAVAATAKGEKFYCTRIIDYLLEKSFSKEKPETIQEEDCSPTPLSPREVEIVRLISKGLIAKEIAEKLSLSTHTTYTHRKNIMKKLNMNSSSELILYALNNGLIPKEQI